MLSSQRKITEKILFDYYMVSSNREDEVYSPFPFYMDKNIFEEMVHSTLVLDKLTGRIIRKFIENPHEDLFYMGDFPFKGEILNCGVPLAPFFWVRYDAFYREKGGIFFSEFNYDKPCAQREILVSEVFNPLNDPNIRFKEAFINGFEMIWKKYGHQNKKRPRVAILVDPGHFEELHLAYLYISLLKPLGYDFIIAGGENFSVYDEKVFVFNAEVDVILRQYPTEFMHEISHFEEILNLYKKGKVLILNDLRAIIGQVKSLFVYLWELVDKKDSFLSVEEAEVIKKTVPYTRIFDPGILEEAKSHKNLYVVKPMYGRYSKNVYIGCMVGQEEWERLLVEVIKSNQTYILQEFCPIKKENVLRPVGSSYTEEEAFGNFGIYLTCGEITGICVRWSTDYLSLDDIVWISPVGIREKSLKVNQNILKAREAKWEEINDKAAFTYGYTGGYTGARESFSLDTLEIKEDMYKELVEATRKMVQVFKKTTRLVQENSQIFCPLLGISDSLSSLVKQEITKGLVFIGRFDWGVDVTGQLKLLELNSETPAGLMESIHLSGLIKENLGIDQYNPNGMLGQKIRNCFTGILNDYLKVKEVQSIGFVTSHHYEDWYNTTVLYELVKDLPYRFILGEVTGMQVIDGKTYLGGVPLDAVYRYYPLDWFDQDPFFEGVVDTFHKGTLSINPSSTFICQSKAFFALVWELLEQGFYCGEEVEYVKKYIPKTALEPKKLKTKDYCAKPYFGREGQEIEFSFRKPGIFFENENYVYQERVDLQAIRLNVHSVSKSFAEILYPVIGTFIVGDDFGGIYTRAGGRVTNKWAVYLPSYIGK
ncbi:MAG: glutathionylspermidine synthase family protein [Clostridia bacterium]|nr:glutathionylspermidine synthase family protein [Clostridia bacterium]